MDTDLQTFLKMTIDVGEYQRGTAVQLALRGKPYAAIRQVLPVSKAFISKWKKIYDQRGMDGLRMAYRGSDGYLTAAQRTKVLTWIAAQDHCDVARVRVHLQEQYGVQYQSQQSYYALLHATNRKWKNVQTSNPKNNDQQVAAKHVELTVYWLSIVTNWNGVTGCCCLSMSVFCIGVMSVGYGWGERNERLTVDVVNTQARQPFYGALDALTGEMHVMPYPVAQTDNTTDFLVELLSRYPDAKLTICWDNARWHKGAEMERFLAEVNANGSPEAWWMIYIHFAPHDPTQNPIEEVWRQGKSAIQKLRLVDTTVQPVVAAFECNIERQFFDFPNRQRYGRLQMI